MHDDDYLPEDKRDNFTDHLSDFLARFEDFTQEHREYMQYLHQKGADGELKPTPIDPQDIFEADSLLKEIEDDNLEDEVDGYDRMKYSGEVYHQFRRFRDEMQTIQVNVLKQKIGAGKRLIASYSGWLDNARAAIARHETDVPTEAEIQSVEAELEAYRNDVAISEFELNALLPSASNWYSTKMTCLTAL